MPRAPRPRWHPVEPSSLTDRLVGLDAIARHVYLELETTIPREVPFAFRCGTAALAEEIGRSVSEVEAALAVLEAQGLIKRDPRTKLVGLPRLLHQQSMAPPNPASAHHLGSAMARLPACALRDELDQTFRAHLEQTGKPGLLAHYLTGRGERPALESVPPEPQLELPLPPPAAAPPALQLFTTEPSLTRSPSSPARGVVPQHADSFLPCDRPRSTPRDGGPESDQERWLEFLEKGPHVTAHTPPTPAADGPLEKEDRDPAGRLRLQSDPPASGARGRAHHERVGQHRLLPSGQEAGKGDAQAGAAQVSGGVRVRANGDGELRAGLERFIEFSRDRDGVARFLVAKIDEQSIYQFSQAVERTGAAPHELDEMARMLASGEEWGLQRGVAIDLLCRKPFRLFEKDHFQALLLKARTPARKPQARAAAQDISPLSSSILEAVAKRRGEAAGG
jgi:hypothetical protein